MLVDISIAAIIARAEAFRRDLENQIPAHLHTLLIRVPVEYAVADKERGSKKLPERKK
jgi:hypothetical protein